jgi:hypothetical protein
MDEVITFLEYADNAIGNSFHPEAANHFLWVEVR